MNLDYEKEGRAIYKSNKNLRSIATMMENPEFREFYNTFLQDFESAKIAIMFLKIYEGAEKYIDTELTPYQKLAVLKNMIEDGKIRQKACKNIQEWSTTSLQADKCQKSILSNIRSIN